MYDTLASAWREKEWEWEDGIPIWCEFCQLRLNGAQQWRDHVEAIKHKKMVVQHIQGARAPKQDMCTEFTGSPEDLRYAICCLEQIMEQIIKDIEDANSDCVEIVEEIGDESWVHWPDKTYVCHCDGHGNEMPMMFWSTTIVSSAKIMACRICRSRHEYHMKKLLEGLV